MYRFRRTAIQKVRFFGTPYMYKIKHPWGESRLSKQLLNRRCLYRSLNWLLNSWHWKRCWHCWTWRVIVLFLMFLLARFLRSGRSDLSSQPANWFPTGSLVLQFYSFTYSKRSMKSMNWRPAWLPWSSLAPSQILPRSTLIKALPPHSQPGAIFFYNFFVKYSKSLGHLPWVNSRTRQQVVQEIRE